MLETKLKVDKSEEQSKGIFDTNYSEIDTALLGTNQPSRKNYLFYGGIPLPKDCAVTCEDIIKYVNRKRF
jgi:hypothetical protein